MTENSHIATTSRDRGVGTAASDPVFDRAPAPVRGLSGTIIVDDPQGPTGETNDDNSIMGDIFEARKQWLRGEHDSAVELLFDIVTELAHDATPALVVSVTPPPALSMADTGAAWPSPARRLWTEPTVTVLDPTPEQQRALVAEIAKTPMPTKADIRAAILDLHERARFLGGEIYDSGTEWRCGPKGMDGDDYAKALRATVTMIDRMGVEILSLELRLDAAEREQRQPTYTAHQEADAINALCGLPFHASNAGTVFSTVVGALGLRMAKP